MSEKLKTLKDIESWDKWGDTLQRFEIKQEAIKDIKHFQKLLDSLPEYNKKYAHKNKERKELPKEVMEGV